MLSKVILSNFVHFRDEQQFDFSGGGAFFFIGGNRSGKSCVFEAIKRCMSTSKNFFFSTSDDKEKPLVVICEYSDTQHCKMIYSCYVSIRLKTHGKEATPCTEKETNGEKNSLEPVVVKIFFIKDQSNFESQTIYELSVDLLKKNSDGFPVNYCFEIDEESKQRAEKHLCGAITIDSIHSFVKNFVRETKEINESTNKVEDYNGKTPCEKSLKRHVDNQIVITVPMRSISPFQWTKSKKLDVVRRRRENINFVVEMAERSEILAWYLNLKDIDPDEDTETAKKIRRVKGDGEIFKSEKKKVYDTFNVLTNNSKIKFERNGDEIVVIDNGNTISLEKAPEGIFEAMICSILLSMDDFKTVCLEEPGRGMHMQMVERLRDFILKGITNKTVIIVSHIPTFLSSWNLDNIFFFKGSITNKNESYFTAIQGNSILTDKEGKSKRIMTNSTMATIFFAKRVLLVEGEFDLRFMAELKSILFENTDMIKSLFKIYNEEQKESEEADDLLLDGFRQFVSSLHILNLQGEQNKYRVAKVCRALKLERYFLLDYDAIFEKKDDLFVKEFILCGKGDSLETTKADDPLFGEKGIFVWRNDLLPNDKNVNGGTIENVLYCMCEENPEVKKTLEENKVKLTLSEKSGKRQSAGRAANRHAEENVKPDSEVNVKRVITKLFKEKELTDENVQKTVMKVIEVSLEQKKHDLLRFLKFVVKAYIETFADEDILKENESA